MMVLRVYCVGCYLHFLFSGFPRTFIYSVAYQSTFLFHLNCSLWTGEGNKKLTIMKKNFLRKMFVAFAAVLLCANVMAQSFDFTKEFDSRFDMEEVVEEGVMIPFLTTDGFPRLILVEESEGNGGEYDSDGNYCYTYKIDKLSILDKNLNIEKEFISGPLFEEFVDVVAKSAAKTLKLVSVDTISTGESAMKNFYYDFSYSAWDGWTNYKKCVDDNTEDKVREYVEAYIEKYYEETTYNSERLIFDDYNVMKSNYFDWGTQYPTTGWIYKDHNDICYLHFNYEPDDYEEISRYNSEIYCAYYEAGVWYIPIGTGSDGGGCQVTISQGLFNDDTDYEFLLPEMAILERSSYSPSSGVLTTYYEYEPVGFKIVSEDGTVLHRLLINEAQENDVRCYADVMSLGDKSYLIVGSYKRVDGEYGDYDYTDEVTRFYEIKKDGTGIQKVREMRGGMNIRPTVANRDEQITITLDDDNNVARELIITGVNGQLVERRTIPVGERIIQMNAAMMRSGMYNFTLQKKGEVVDNGKVIVK